MRHMSFTCKCHFINEVVEHSYQAITEVITSRNLTVVN